MLLFHVIFHMEILSSDPMSPNRRSFNSSIPHTLPSFFKVNFTSSSFLSYISAVGVQRKYQIMLIPHQPLS
jgi:hypothetical protein